MRVGGIHRWYYDRGEWKEKKVAPDKWEFTYATNKRRAWNAPEGSGASVGTEYYWYILAHQNVRKLDANTYTTSISFVISVTNRNWTFLDLRSYNPFLNSSTPIATDGQV